MVFVPTVVHEVFFVKTVMLPVVHVCISCYGLRSVHTIKTQAIEVRPRYDLSSLHRFLVVTATKGTTTLCGLKGEIVEPLKNGLHR